MYTSLHKTESALSSFYTDFKTHGISHRMDLQESFKGGDWVDWRKVPIINENKIDPNTIINVFGRHVSATAINWAWHSQRVWLMSYPMTEDECKFNSPMNEVERPM